MLFQGLRGLPSDEMLAGVGLATDRSRSIGHVEVVEAEVAVFDIFPWHPCPKVNHCEVAGRASDFAEFSQRLDVRSSGMVDKEG